VLSPTIMRRARRRLHGAAALLTYMPSKGGRVTLMGKSRPTS
jgi:hypothetical protein